MSEELRAAALGRVFGANPFGQLLGFELAERLPDRVRVRLPWRADLRNVTGNHHGGVIASLVDVAAAAAVWNGHDFERGGRRLMTLSMSLQYLGAAPEQELTCEAWCPRRGRDVVFAEMLVSAVGSLVATAHATFGIRA